MGVDKVPPIMAILVLDHVKTAIEHLETVEQVHHALNALIEVQYNIGNKGFDMLSDEERVKAMHQVEEM
mgnify:CR=1 FL=1